MGMCCQAAFQIRHHAKLLAHLSGDPTAAISGMPFDWLICHPEAAIKMLQEDKFYPCDVSELSVSQGAYWMPFDVYFWHEFRVGKLDSLIGRNLNPERSYRRLSEKYRYMANKFRHLEELERLIFVICNTQNNLPLAANLTGTIDYVLSRESINRLAEASDNFFGRPCEYIFVTYEKWARGHSKRNHVAVHELAVDQSEWQGDPAQWEGVFRKTFVHGPPQSN